MGKLLKNLILSTSFLMALSSPSFGESRNYRIHTSIGYHENKQILSGTGQKYNPLRTRLGIEFDTEFLGFDKFFVSSFYGQYGRGYDFGMDFGLKKIYRIENVEPYLYTSFGGVHFSEEFKEHKYKNNFNVNLGAGLEVKISRNSALTFAFNYGHISKGKKLWNNIRNLTTKGNNEGNPGLNTFGFVIGWVYKPK